MEKAQRDTYKRVNLDNGKYHYPQLPENRLRVRGQQEYFRKMEITGSNKGTKKEPKFDLLSWFEEVEIPALKRLCEQVATSGKRPIVRYQMDGAGPHQDTTLNNFLEEALTKRRWILKFQPSNLPITNVKDDCVFPALSKHVSGEQGITKGSQIFSLDELRAAVEKCWREISLDSLARGYVQHGQIASALIECEGGDDFVRNHGGLHHNVRNCSCVTVCDDNGTSVGVEMVSCYSDTNDNNENVDDNNPDNNTQQKLKYKILDVGESLSNNLARMTSAEIRTLFHSLPTRHDWLNPCVAEAFVALEDAQLSDNDAD